MNQWRNLCAQLIAVKFLNRIFRKKNIRMVFLHAYVSLTIDRTHVYFTVTKIKPLLVCLAVLSSNYCLNVFDVTTFRFLKIFLGIFSYF